MPKRHYTCLRGRVTYFRRKIPSDLRKRLASSEICIRIGVITTTDAEQIGRRLAVETDLFIENARVDPMLDEAALRQFVTATMSDWQINQERQTVQLQSDFGRATSISARNQALIHFESARELLVAHDEGRSLYDDVFIKERFEAANLPVPDDQLVLGVAGRRLNLALALHYLDTAIAIARRHGLGSGWRALPIHEWQERAQGVRAALGLARDSEAPGPRSSDIAGTAHMLGHTIVPKNGTCSSHSDNQCFVPDRTPRESSNSETEPQRQTCIQPDANNHDERLRFSKLFAQSLDMRAEEGRLGDKQRHTTNSSLRIWIETIGDRPVTGYARQDMAAYRSFLKTIPKLYWRSASERRKPIQQVCAEADAKAKATGKPVERLGPVTINKHLSNIGSFFAWAQKEQYLPDITPFWGGFHLPTGEAVTGLAEHEERPAFSNAQIETIFKHPVWTGRASENRYNKAGTLIIRDALYWGPLIAVYSLMRREEIFQLKVKHIREEEGIWVFDLHHHELSLKNAASRRLVPLHRHLLELGFIETMVRKRNPEEQLFPELSRSAVHNTFGDKIGKKFASIIDFLGIVVMRKDGKESHGAFHPLRHYGETILLNAKVPAGIVDAIAGHKSSARDNEKRSRETVERTRYNKGYYVTTLKNAIDEIEAPIDIAELKRRVRECKRFNRRRRNAGGV